MIKTPNIKSMPRQVSPEVRAAFAEMAQWFKQVEAAGGVATGDALNRVALDAAVVDNLSPLFDSTIPPQIDDVEAHGGFAKILITWTNPGFKNLDKIEIYRNTVDDVGCTDESHEMAFCVGIVDGTSVMFSDSPPDSSASVEYYYWIIGVSTAGLKGPVSSPTAHDHTALDPTYALELLSGRITTDQLSNDLNANISGHSAGITQFIEQYGEGLLQTNVNVAILSDVVRAVTATNAEVALEVYRKVSAILPPSWQANEIYAPNQCVLHSVDGIAPEIMYQNTWGDTIQDTTWIAEHWTAKPGSVDLYGEYYVKVDADGKVGGFGLSNDSVTSRFIVNVDEFAVTRPVQFKSNGSDQPVAVTNGHTVVLNDEWAKLDGSVWKWMEDPDDSVVKWMAQKYRATPFAVSTAGFTGVNGETIPAGVYIDGASIGHITAENVVAGGIDVDNLVVTDTATIWNDIIDKAMITNAFIGNVIESGDGTDSHPNRFISSQQGWRIDKNGNCEFQNGIFRGDITGSTGLFAGKLQAGVINIEELVGSSLERTVPGIYYESIPAGIDSIKFTVIGGGGGGGGHSDEWDLGQVGAGGGTGGYYFREAFSYTVTPGAQITISIGQGGLGGEYENHGQDGHDSYIEIGGHRFTATGGKGGLRNYMNPGAGGSPNGIIGCFGWTETATSVVKGDSRTTFIGYHGGNGGSLPNIVGGQGGIGAYVLNNTNIPATAGTRGAGGGGAKNASPHTFVGIGGNGGDGYVLLEFYSKYTVVLRSELESLKAALAEQDIRVIPNG